MSSWFGGSKAASAALESVSINPDKPLTSEAETEKEFDRRRDLFRDDLLKALEQMTGPAHQYDDDLKTWNMYCSMEPTKQARWTKCQLEVVMEEPRHFSPVKDHIALIPLSGETLTPTEGWYKDIPIMVNITPMTIRLSRSYHDEIVNDAGSASDSDSDSQ